MSKHAKGEAPIKEEPDFFSDLEPAEHRACRDYLFSQEIVRQERLIRRELRTTQHTDPVPGLVRPGECKATVHSLRPEDWLLTRRAIMRKAWRLRIRRPGKNFITQIAETPIWFMHPAARLVMLWPEWPKKSYFEIPRDERLCRIKVFSVLNEKDQLAALAYLINPHNPTTKKKVVLQVAILASANLQAHLDAFEALLRIHAPELFEGVKAPQAKGGGRKSDEARILDDLNAVAAHQLCKVQKFPRARVIRLICYPKGHRYAGKPVYGTEHELNKPLRSFPRHLQAFRFCLLQNLVPLKPFGEVSPPDWTLLDEAIAANPKPWEGSASDIADLEELFKRFKGNTIDLEELLKRSKEL